MYIPAWELVFEKKNKNKKNKTKTKKKTNSTNDKKIRFLQCLRAPMIQVNKQENNIFLSIYWKNMKTFVRVELIV